MITLKKQHRRHDKYRKINLSWLIELPAEWRLKRLKYATQINTDKLPDEINFSQGSICNDRDAVFTSSFEENDNTTDDDLYEDARMIVIESKKASTSYLQRRLKLGYARAARLMDMLEERGVIGPGDGAKPREVLERQSGDQEPR